MSNLEIYNEWSKFIEEYKEYVFSNEEGWINKLNKVKEYIDVNNKRPSQQDKDKNIKVLGGWISNQQKKYKTKKEIMSEPHIYSEWTHFIEKYKEYFLSNVEYWQQNLESVKEYIDQNNKRPSSGDKNKDIKILSKWIQHQQENYKIKKEIMSNPMIYSEWTQFMEKYKEYFLSNEELWYQNLNKVSEYIDINNKRPSSSDKNKDIKTLGSWINNQQNNYKIKIKIMAEPHIYNKWTEFIEEYKEYVFSNEEGWNNNLNKVKEYINTNNKRPSQHDKNENIKVLGNWISCQLKNYKTKIQIMTNIQIYEEWSKFIEKYKEYFSY